MNLIILEPQDCLEANQYKLTDERADHIRSVLRSHHLDTLEVGLLNGPIGSGNVVSIDKTAVVRECSFNQEMPPQPEINIDLIVALPRPQTLKKVLATAASMGVKNIHLIRANRVEKSYFHSPLLQRLS